MDALNITTEFDRQKLLDNIGSLIKQKNLKIGDVEKSAGISPGYLSRLTKKETETAPGADIIWKIAKVLGVSTDMLIEGDFSKASDNLRYIGNFLTNLKIMTEENILTWNTISIADVNNALRSSNEDLFIIGNMENREESNVEIRGMADDAPFETSLIGYGSRRIVSAACPGNDIWLCGPAYWCDLDEYGRFYIFLMMGEFPTEVEDNEVAFMPEDYFDMYIEIGECGFDHGTGDMQNPKPLCNTINNAKELSGEARALYQAISRRVKDLKLDKGVRSAIDHFLERYDRNNFI